jgi:hypothetical protein
MKAERNTDILGLRVSTESVALSDRGRGSNEIKNSSKQELSKVADGMRNAGKQEQSKSRNCPVAGRKDSETQNADENGPQVSPVRAIRKRSIS